MKNKKEENKKEENKKLVYLGLISICVVILIPAILGWIIIPKESFIPGFKDDNDWIGFYGSYIGAILGGIVTLITLYKTRKDTRKIQAESTKLQEKNIELQESLIDLQKRMIEIEEENQLKNSRTIFIEGSAKDNFKLSNINKKFNDDYLIKNNYYNHITEVVLKKSFFVQIESSVIAEEYNNWLTRFGDYNQLAYKTIKNVGENNMYCVLVRLVGNWKNIDESETEDTLIFSIDCIEQGRSILMPIFKLDYDENIISFDIKEMKVEYETGILGKREKILVETDYDSVSKKYNKKISINKIESNVFEQYDYNNYLIIRNEIE